jgi:hypothetical protein
MSNNIQFNDTSNLNKGLGRAILEGVYIGNLFNLRIDNYPVFKTLINTFKYFFSKQTIQTLQETQIRFYGDYTIVGKKIIKYYQLSIPNISNVSDDLQSQTLDYYAAFLNNIKTYQNIEIFYYDRAESLGDFDFYFLQLDNKIKDNNHTVTEEGLQLLSSLRYEMPDVLQEIIDTYATRTREAFIVVHQDITGNNIDSLKRAILGLDNKVLKLVTSVNQLNCTITEVTGEHRSWLLSNFVSNVTQF